MKARKQKVWMLYKADLRAKPVPHTPHIVEVQRGYPEDFDKSWAQFVLVPKKKGKSQ